jgi:hypothetical protein
MREFFKPLRRKIGVLTLVLACVFAAGWVRSLQTTDFVRIPVKNHAWIEMVGRTASVHLYATYHGKAKSNFLWKTISAADEEQESPSFFSPSDLQIHALGVGIGKISYPSRDWIHRVVVILPYFSITIPLTLLSAFLLLSKPRKSNQKKTAELVQVEGK